MYTPVDYQRVTLYTIHVTKSDHTGYFLHYLREEIASQEFWKATRSNFAEILLKKESYLRKDLPFDVREIIEKLEREERKQERDTDKAMTVELK